MNQIQHFSDPGQVIDVASISICLILTFLLSVVVAKTYQITYRGASFSPSFMVTLVICAMVIGAVMMIIGSNIARAFSLVGALSIIRFRNAVKDPRDVAYIFLCMGIGMACGTGFYTVAIVLTSITCGASLFLAFIEFGEHGLSERLVRVQIPITSEFEGIFDDTFKLHADQFNLVSAETTRMGTELELTFSIKVPKKFSAAKLIEDLSALNQNLRVQVVGSNHLLDL